MTARGWLALLALAAAAPATAFPVAPPEGAVTVLSPPAGPGSLVVATGPFAPGQRPVRVVEGQVETLVWRVDRPEVTSFAVMKALAEAAGAAGFMPGFGCETALCGGFDFRYGIPLAAAPDMEADLGDFRYLAFDGPGGATLTFFVSKAGRAVHVQASVAAPAGTVPTAAPPAPATAAPSPAPAPAAEPEPAPATAPPGLAGLDGDAGRAVLPGVDFASGSADLLPGSEATIAALAAWLSANPAARVLIVGHTDATGNLDANLALSRRRAETVAAALDRAAALSPGRLIAAGAGPLAPLDSNLTEAGRARNRRVEVVRLP